MVLAGSNGEAVALTGEERLELIKLTRETAIGLDRKDMPIVIGTVGQTTKEIVTQLCASHTAGADFGLVLTPSYFHFAMDGVAIQEFFTQVRHPLRIRHKLRVKLTDRVRWPMKAQSPFSSIAGRL